MTIVAGYAPDARGRAPLHLAAWLARSADEDVVVCTVVPRPWFPSMAKIDAEYQAALHKQADDALAQARTLVPSDIRATFLRHAARSTPAGLLEVTQGRDADVIVLGSSTDGAFGHITLGSVTAQLLHSAHVPVALAPRGFRDRPGGRVRRVTLAYGGTEQAHALVLACARVAAQVGASLRLAAFAVWSRPAYTMRLGTDSEDAVLGTWLTEIRDSAMSALAEARQFPDVPRDMDAVVGIGGTWEEAFDDVDWDDGDVLAVGSSAMGSLSRVFLGSTGTKIVRNSPVPVVVVPRSAFEDAAEGSI